MPFIFDGWHYYVLQKGEEMRQIHKFHQSGVYVVLDVNSGAVHRVDELIWDLLEYYRVMDKQQIADKLAHKYRIEDIWDGLAELDQLVDNGLLYSDDAAYEAFIPNAEDITPVIKAYVPSRFSRL